MFFSMLNHTARVARFAINVNLRQNQIARTQDWCQQQKLFFDKTYFYSDSINDLPLFLEVDEPRVVNPDPKLLKEAQSRSWPVEYF